MGISSTTNRQVYQGDGTSATFAFPYYFAKQTDLQVYLYDLTAGVITPQVLNGGSGTGFTISGTVNAAGLYTQGGSVVFNSSPVNTSQIVINREPALNQNYTLGTNGLISSAALVNQLDYLTLQTQFLKDQVSRSVQLADGMGSSFNTALPSNMPISSLAANAPIIINSTATGFTYGLIISGTSTAAVGFLGVLPTVNGGTGTAIGPTPFGLAYGNSAGNALLTTTSGPPGYVMMSNGSSAPTFQAFSLGSGSIPAGNIIGILDTGNGGTGTGTSYVQNAIIYASSPVQLGGSIATLTGPGTLTIPSGQRFLAPDGTLSSPSIAFSGEGSTGLYRIGALNLGIGVNGINAINMLQTGSVLNLGFGVAPYNTTGQSVIFGRTVNQQVTVEYANNSLGLSANSTLTTTVAGASGIYTNMVCYTNQGTYAPNAYLTQLSQLESGFNMLGMNFSCAYAQAKATWTFGNPSTPNEAMSLTNLQLTLNKGVLLGLTGSSISGGTLTMSAANSSASYAILWPKAQGAASSSLQNDGSGNLSWAANAGLPFTLLGDTVYAGAAAVSTRLAGNISNSSAMYVQTGSGGFSAAPSWRIFAPPSIQTISGSSAGTYTVPAGALYLRIRGIGGGGGGGGSGSAGGSTGATGGSTIFGSSVLAAAIIAGPGVGGTVGNGGGGSGGGGSTSGANLINGVGDPGQAFTIAATAANAYGPDGASTIYGAGGTGGVNGGGTGSAASSNSGAGGGAAGGNTAVMPGGSGGGGGFFEHMLANPAASYPYIAGGGGIGGTAGTSGGAGGNAGGGYIIFEAHFQ